MRHLPVRILCLTGSERVIRVLGRKDIDGENGASGDGTLPSHGSERVALTTDGMGPFLPPGLLPTSNPGGESRYLSSV